MMAINQQGEYVCRLQPIERMKNSEIAWFVNLYKPFNESPFFNMGRHLLQASTTSLWYATLMLLLAIVNPLRRNGVATQKSFRLLRMKSNDRRYKNQYRHRTFTSHQNPNIKSEQCRRTGRLFTSQFTALSISILGRCFDFIHYQIAESRLLYIAETL